MLKSEATNLTLSARETRTTSLSHSRTRNARTHLCKIYGFNHPWNLIHKCDRTSNVVQNFYMANLQAQKSHEIFKFANSPANEYPRKSKKELRESYLLPRHRHILKKLVNCMGNKL